MLYRLTTKALRLEKRHRLVESRLRNYTPDPSGNLPKEAEENYEDLGWFLTILTDGPPVSFYLGTEKPSLPLTLHIEVTQ